MPAFTTKIAIEYLLQKMSCSWVKQLKVMVQINKIKKWTRLIVYSRVRIDGKAAFGAGFAFKPLANLRESSNSLNVGEGFLWTDARR